MTHPVPHSLSAPRGWACLRRGVAVAAIAALAAGLGATGVAWAAETPTDPTVAWVTRPVDPQPVVAGHEGDVLLEVNVVMAATVAAPALTRPVVAKASKAGKAGKASNAGKAGNASTAGNAKHRR